MALIMALLQWHLLDVLPTTVSEVVTATETVHKSCNHAVERKIFTAFQLGKNSMPGCVPLKLWDSDLR